MHGRERECGPYEAGCNYLSHDVVIIIFINHSTNQGISSIEVIEKLVPFPDDSNVLPRAAAESELTTSGSGSISGSGDLLVPTTTESMETPDYNTKSFISLTFTNLSSQQHELLQEQLRNLLIRLLELDSSPLIIIESVFMSTSIVLVYFPVSLTTLEFYAKTLRSINDAEWSNLSSSYVSGQVVCNVVVSFSYFSGFDRN